MAVPSWEILTQWLCPPLPLPSPLALFHQPVSMFEPVCHFDENLLVSLFVSFPSLASFLEELLTCLHWLVSRLLGTHCCLAERPATPRTLRSCPVLAANSVGIVQACLPQPCTVHCVLKILIHVQDVSLFIFPAPSAKVVSAPATEEQFRFSPVRLMLDICHALSRTTFPPFSSS